MSNHPIIDHDCHDRAEWWVGLFGFGLMAMGYVGLLSVPVMMVLGCAAGPL